MPFHAERCASYLTPFHIVGVGAVGYAVNLCALSANFTAYYAIDSVRMLFVAWWVMRYLEHVETPEGKYPLASLSYILVNIIAVLNNLALIFSGVASVGIPMMALQRAYWGDHTGVFTVYLVAEAIFLLSAFNPYGNKD